MSATITITEKRDDTGDMEISIVSDDTGATSFEHKHLHMIMKLIAYAAGSDFSPCEEEYDE